MKKKGFNISVNISNKTFYTLLAFAVIIFVGIGVFAYGTSTPSNFGHSAKELDLSQGVEGNAVFNGDVNVSGQVKGQEICIGDECQSSWPADKTCNASGTCSQLCIGDECQSSWSSGELGIANIVRSFDSSLPDYFPSAIVCDMISPPHSTGIIFGHVVLIMSISQNPQVVANIVSYHSTGNEGYTMPYFKDTGSAASGGFWGGGDWPDTAYSPSCDSASIQDLCAAGRCID